ncbi:MAG: branched-chain amino acid ABC transporter permease [Thermodesulfobacteriota bacterium]
MFLQILITNLAASSYYVLFAVSFALVLKVTKIWNFAQAGMMTTAFYCLYWAVTVRKMPFYLAIPLAVVMTSLLAAGVEKFAFQTLRRRKSTGFAFFIFTMIFAQFLAYLFTLIFGTEPFTVEPSIFSPVIPVGSLIVTHWDIKAFVLALTLLVLLYILLRWSKPGKYMLAVSNNDRLAELYGISSTRSYLWSMIIAAVLCTFGMYILGLKIAVYPHFTLHIILFAVAATVIGGIGNVFGAAAGAVVLSLLQGLSIMIIPSKWQNLLVYFFFFGIIIFMPSGFATFVRELTGKKQ